MAKIRITAILEYDDELMHADDDEAKDWFFNDILGAPKLRLIEVDIMGDEVGELSIEEWEVVEE